MTGSPGEAVGEVVALENDLEAQLQAMETELRVTRTMFVDKAKQLEVVQHEHDVLERKNQGLRAELIRLEGMHPTKKNRLLEPVGNLLEGVRGVDQARTLLAELSDRIAESLEEREALLMYVLEKAPDAPEKQQRERVEQIGDVGHSVIKRLRIGMREKSRYCEKCGQPSKEYCSAHIFIGFYSDWRPGELFVRLDRRHGNAIAGGGYHVGSRMASLALQHGCHHEVIARQLRHQKDSSAGRPWGVDGPRKDLSNVNSLSDYIGLEFERIVERKQKEYQEALAAEAERASKEAAQIAPATPAPEPEPEPKP